MDAQEKNVAPSVATVETPEFNERVEAWAGKYYSSLRMVREGWQEQWSKLIAHIDAHVTAQVAAKDAEIARLQKLVAEQDAMLGKRPCQNNRCVEYAALSAQAAAPVAYLRFRAAQQWSGVGGSDIEYAEWYETCQAHEIGDDKKPAFPVYAVPQPSPAPVAMTDEQIDAIAAHQKIWRCMTPDGRTSIDITRKFARAILAAQQEAK